MEMNERSRSLRSLVNFYSGRNYCSDRNDHMETRLVEQVVWAMDCHCTQELVVLDRTSSLLILYSKYQIKIKLTITNICRNHPDFVIEVVRMLY
jgi:hypothetical protein